MIPNRRSFLKKSACASVAIPLFNIGVVRAESGKINHASFGASGMAGGDINSLLRTKKVNLVAVAEVDDSKLERVLKAAPNVRVYKDWRVLLEKEHKNLDSVNVSTPDHMHAPIGVTAMNLGLHVYGQKPLAQTIYETRIMANVARKTKVVTQMGIQLSSGFYERMAVQIIDDGLIGNVEEVYIFSNKTWGDPTPRPDRTDPIPASLDWDLWCGVGPKPNYINKYYHPGAWRKRLDYGTGTLGDMGCHIYSPMFRAMGFKAPLAVRSVGGVPNKHNWAVDEKLEYIFPGTPRSGGKNVKVTWCDGALRPPKEITDLFGSKMPSQGSIFIGKKGQLLAPHGGVPIPFPREKFEDFRPPKLKARNHYGDFVDAVMGKNVEPIADFHKYGGPLTETILLGSLASRFPEEILKWDPKKLRFTNNEEANKFIRREYRSGWKVKGLS